MCVPLYRHVCDARFNFANFYLWASGSVAGYLAHTHVQCEPLICYHIFIILGSACDVGLQSHRGVGMTQRGGGTSFGCGGSTQYCPQNRRQTRGPLYLPEPTNRQCWFTVPVRTGDLQL